MFSCAPTQCAVPHDGRESLMAHLQTDFSVEVMVITDVVRGLVRIQRIFQESLQIWLLGYCFHLLEGLKCVGDVTDFHWRGFLQWKSWHLKQSAPAQLDGEVEPGPAPDAAAASSSWQAAVMSSELPACTEEQASSAPLTSCELIEESMAQREVWA